MVTGEKLREWKRENAYKVQFDLNRSKDARIIEKLEQQENKAAYIKGLISKDIDQGAQE